MQEKEEHILNMAEAVFEGAFLANTYYQIISEIRKHQKHVYSGLRAVDARSFSPPLTEF